MANSIEIEIVANFKDNASGKAKEIGVELDKLDKRSVIIDVGINDRATAVLDEINTRLSQFDGSQAARGINEVAERAGRITNSNNEMRMTANTTATDRPLTELENRIENINRNAELNVNMGGRNGFVTSDGQFVAWGGMAANQPETSATEHMADEVSNTSNSIRRGGPVRNIDDAITGTAVHKELVHLRSQAAEYGIDISPNASINAMRQAVMEYEERNFTPQSAAEIERQVSENVARNETRTQAAVIRSASAAESNSPDIVHAAEEQGQEITSGYFGNLAQGMRQVTGRVASRFMGARMLYKGINEAASDFSDAFQAENEHDRNRSLARGSTKGGLMAAGAFIGTAIPGVGTLLGAGAGALVSTLFGDDIADAISGLHKSLEEIRIGHLDEIFGNFALSTDNLAQIASRIITESGVQRNSAHRRSYEEGYSMQEELQTSHEDLSLLGGKIRLMDNLQLKVSESDLKGYKEQSSQYMDDALNTVVKEMYNSFMNFDDLFGYDNWDTTELSGKYEELFKQIEKNRKELDTYLDKALKDGQLSSEEIEHATAIIKGTQKLVEDSLPNEADINRDSMMFLARNGMLSQKSHDELSAAIVEEMDSGFISRSQERARAIAMGHNKEDADNAFWSGVIDDTEGYLQIGLQNARNFFHDDYETGMTYLRNNQQWLSLDKEDGNLNKYLNESNDWLIRSENAADESFAATSRLNAIDSFQNARNEITNPFVQFAHNEKTKEVSTGFDAMYNDMAPIMHAAQEQYVAAVKAGQDPTQYLDEMMMGYMIGGLGGNTTAMEKYAALKMFGNKEARQFMQNMYGNDYEQLKSDMTGGGGTTGFGEMIEMLLTKPDKDTGGTDTETDPSQAAAEGSQKAAEAIRQGSQEIADASNESAEKTAESFSDSVNKKKNTIGKGLEDFADEAEKKADEAAEGVKNSGEKMTEGANELGKNIIDAVSESLDKIDADMLSDSNIGEKLMSAIGEGIDTMDFENIQIGEQLMSAIGEAVDTMDFEGISIGESIMSAISEAVDTMDFSEISVGESVIDGISQSIDTMDFEGISIGESIMAAIVEDVDTMDLEEIGIGESIMDGIGAAVDTMDFSGVNIGAQIMDGINSSLEGVDFSGITEGITSQFQELSELQCDIELNATDNISDKASAANAAVTQIPEQWETTLTAIDNASSVASSVAAAVKAIPTSVSINITASTSGLPAGFHFASGTHNAPEGLAMINDDGTSDPRELIEHNGRLMMYEGRDVIAPLSKGDRVFTSAQTKDILSGKGIPHFAAGVNNEVIANNREIIGANSGGASVSIEQGAVQITVEVNGASGNVIEEIRSRISEVAEPIVAEIERQLSASFANASGGDR